MRRAQDAGACFLDPLGDHFQLLGGFHGAGPGDQGKGAVPNCIGAHLDDGVIRMKFPVGFLIRLLNALYALYDSLCTNILNIDFCRIAQQPEHSGVLAIPCVDGHAVGLIELIGKVLI